MFVVCQLHWPIRFAMPFASFVGPHNTNPLPPLSHVKKKCVMTNIKEHFNLSLSLPEGKHSSEQWWSHRSRRNFLYFWQMAHSQIWRQSQSFRSSHHKCFSVFLHRPALLLNCTFQFSIALRTKPDYSIVHQDLMLQNLHRISINTFNLLCRRRQN